MDREGPVQPPGRWRVALLAIVFALVSHGCFILAISLTRSPL
jgi:hypothetical protein